MSTVHPKSAKAPSVTADAGGTSSNRMPAVISSLPSASDDQCDLSPGSSGNAVLRRAIRCRGKLPDEDIALDQFIVIEEARQPEDMTDLRTDRLIE